MNRVAHRKAVVADFDHADIALLAAHRRIERRLVGHNRALIALCERFGKRRCILLALVGENANHRRNLALVRQPVIAGELGRELRIDLLVSGLRLTHIVRGLSRLPRGLPLHLHRLLEARFIDRETALRENLPRQIEREPVGVVELERVLAGELGLFLRGERLLEFRENREPLVNRAVELRLFLGQHL